MAGETTYDPGQSFVEHDHPTDRLTSMPAWLQRFAAQEGEDDLASKEPSSAAEAPGAEQEAVTPDAVDGPVEAESDAESVFEPQQEPDSTEPLLEEWPHNVEVRDDVLPDWLRGDHDEARDNQGDAASDSTPEPFDSPSSGADTFISEDDLPDWLRAFSEEVGSEPAPSRSAASERNVTRLAPALQSVGVRVPPVENVWLSSFERQALGPGASLFALLAANPGGESETYQAAGAGEAQPAGGSEARGAHAGTVRDRASTDTERQPADDRAAAQPGSRRWLLLTLLLVMIIVLISVWQFS